jgi:predicted lactoylglutathione lyase
MERNEKLSFRVENIQPILSVKNIEASRVFYIELLGFQEAPWGDDNFTSVSRDNCGIYLCKGVQGNTGTWIWIGFDGDILALHDQFRSKGIKIIQPSVNYSWAMEMRIEDPDGHVLRFGTDPNNNKPFSEG